MANMTQLWTSVYAALPGQWEFRGVVAGPREADPAVSNGRWCAWARGPNPPYRVEGTAETPDGAMSDLLNRLRALA